MLFRTPAILPPEAEVLRKIEDIRSALATPRPWTVLVRRTTLAGLIRASSRFEDDDVTPEGAIAVEGAGAEGDEPIGVNPQAWAAVSGYRAALSYAFQLAGDPTFTYDEGVLRGLHYMITGYDRTKNPGRWRPGSVHVRLSGEIVYDAPDVGLVPGLLRELVFSLNATDDTPVMITAAMAHLNLTLIHPFSDGNGRTASVLQTLVLARGGIVEPEFASIEADVGAHTADYRAALLKVSGEDWDPTRDARPWIRFCLTAHLRQAKTLLRRTQEHARLWDELDVDIKRRGLPARVLFALADAAAGLKVSSSTYRSAAAVSTHLANRDLKRLVDEGLVIAGREGRARSYRASDKLKELRGRTREPRIPDDDPFATEVGGAG